MADTGIISASSSGQKPLAAPLVLPQPKPSRSHPADVLSDEIMEQRILGQKNGCQQGQPSMQEMRQFLANGQKESAVADTHWDTMAAARENWKKNPVGGIEFRDRPRGENIHEYNLRYFTPPGSPRLIGKVLTLPNKGSTTKDPTPIGPTTLLPVAPITLDISSVKKK